MKEIKIIVDNLSIKGGVESVVTSVANGLAIRGYNVTIVCVKKCIPLFDINDRVKIEYLTNGASKYKKYIALISYYRKKILAGDILYTNSVANSVLAIFCVPKNASIYACDHNKYSAVGKIWSSLRFLLYRKINGIIVLTKHDLEKYLRINKNSKVFDNPVDTCFFNNDGNRTHISQKYILNIGRLELQKGQDLLINAWNLVEKKGFELWICGEGSQRYHLEQQVKTLGLASSVKFLGNRNDIDLLLNGAYCNVLSSRFEGKPLSLIEAKVAGCPNVSFDCETGPSEIIKDRFDGLLIAEGNVAELAKGLQYLIDNPKIRNSYAKNSRADNEKYSIKRVCDEYISFFKV